MAYRFDHAWKEERARLAGIEATFDPWTVRSIEATNPERGWLCLEIGAGGGSIAEWLCRRVAPAGHVVATDLETKFLEALDLPDLEIRKHDIVHDELEDGHYDLIHSRAVLDHLPQRDEIVPRLVRSLKPGGWLTIEGGDFATVQMVGGVVDDATFFNNAFARLVDVSRSFGADTTYGRRLGSVLRSAGLESVDVDGFLTEWDKNHALASLYALTFQRLREPALQNGAMTAEDFDRLLSLIRSPEVHALSHAVYAARGRRPV